MLNRRLTMLVMAAAFAASSSLALLQSAGPALADRDSNSRIAQQRRDRDDWNRKHHKHNTNNGRWHANNGHHNGQNKHHDHDRR